MGKNSQAFDQLFQFLQVRLIDAVANLWTVDFALDQPGLFENFEMLRDGGLSKRQATYDFSAHASVAAYQETEDLDASRMSNRPGKRCQLASTRIGLELDRCCVATLFQCFLRHAGLSSGCGRPRDSSLIYD